jgi:alkanesulfonate monooxygenase SsuD/methylene tetrahydromethanopterin reductase-like flavin-dependent oxidoreductase (luciferase family)
MFGAKLAAAFGLPYAFASHFSPELLDPALAAYRAEFVPSDVLERPYAIAGVNVLAADTMSQAQEQLQAIRRIRAVGLYRRQAGASPVEATDEQADQLLAAGMAAHVDQMLTFTAMGTAREVHSYLSEFAERTGADELITAHHAPGVEARLRSIELLAEATLVSTPGGGGM